MSRARLAFGGAAEVLGCNPLHLVSGFMFAMFHTVSRTANMSGFYRFGMLTSVWKGRAMRWSRGGQGRAGSCAAKRIRDMATRGTLIVIVCHDEVYNGLALSAVRLYMCT